MKVRSKIFLVGMTAALVLIAVAGTASARRLELSNTGFRAVWNPLVFINPAEGVPFRCPVTLEGSFHSRTISKIANALIGLVTKAALGTANCTGVSAIALTGRLPWHLQYESFTGALPNITRINIKLIGMEWLVTVFGVSCLYATTAANPAKIIASREAGGILTDWTMSNTASIPKISGGILCPESLALEGRSTALTVLNSATRIAVRLVA